MRDTYSRFVPNTLTPVNVQIAIIRLALFSGLGAVTLGTFAVLFSPWLGSLSLMQQCIHRIFPLARGIFEDKVSLRSFSPPPSNPS